MTSSTSSSERRRLRLLRGLAPIGLALGAYASGVAGFEAFVEPHRAPATGGQQWRRGEFLDLGPEMSMPIFRVGRIDADTLVVAGDSRVQSGISLPELSTPALGSAALLCGPSAQTVDLVQAARRYPARRLVLALSPLGLYCPQEREIRRQLRRLRRPWGPAKLEDALDSWFADHHRRLVHVVALGTGDEGEGGDEPDFELTQPYFERNLAQRTRGERSRRAVVLLEDLQALRSEGWQVVVVRIPCHARLLALEDEAFDARLFAGVCERAGVPFLDFAHEGHDFPTTDGSHLTVEGGKAFTRLLAAALEQLPPMRAR